jgi:agmatinase
MQMNKQIETLASILTQPGSGVHTVHTASEKKEILYQKYYQSKCADSANKNWRDSLKNLRAELKKKPALLGICSDTGGGILRGANWGPLFLRLELLKSVDTDQFFDLGDIRCIPHLLHDKYLNEETITSCREALYQDKESTLPVSPLSLTEKALDTLYEINPDAKIISMGGDHSVSYPLVKSCLRNAKKHGKRVGLVHFDAHTDLLDKRLGIDLCFGSWTYHILDDLTETNDLHQLGIRSSGKDKKFWENKFDIHQTWASEIFEHGAGKIADTLIADLKSKDISDIYISFDIDAIDSEYASATGTPEPNGLKPHDVNILLAKILSEFNLIGADMVEVAPFINNDIERKSNSLEPDSTLSIGAHIIELFIDACQKSE